MIMIDMRGHSLHIAVVVVGVLVITTSPGAAVISGVSVSAVSLLCPSSLVRQQMPAGLTAQGAGRRARLAPAAAGAAALARPAKA